MKDMVWYKGSFAGFAPIWISDPMGECYVDGRGVLGFILLPVAEFFVQSINLMKSFMDAEYEGGFPMYYDDRKTYTR